MQFILVLHFKANHVPITKDIYDWTPSEGYAEALNGCKKMNEFYHYNRTLIIGAHILFVLIFVILLAI